MGAAHPWQYAGGYFESSTGFVKFGTRYYDPAWGRWTQQDPVAGSLGSPDSLNRYLYVGNNPVSVVDPSGKGFLDCLFQLAAYGVFGYAILTGLWNLILAGAFFLFSIIGFNPGVLLISAIFGAATALIGILVYNAASSACGWKPVPLP